jgi:hypothetical protein
MQVRANRFWRDIEMRFGEERTRVPVGGTLTFDFESKVFAGSGNGRQSARPRASGTVVSASLSEHLAEGGMRLQCYWRFQYDLDIGGLSELGRRYRVARLLNTRVTGLSNIIQTFDILPGRGRTRDYDATFRNVRVDNRGASMSAWEFDFSHDRAVVYSRDMASISTSTVARLPVNLDISLSAEVSTQIGAELSVEPMGVGVGGSGSVGASTGASVGLSFRRTMDLTMIAEVQVPTRVG